MSYYNSNSSNNKQFHRSESVPSATKRLVEMLDHVEERVALLREHASAIESERNALLCILSSLKSSKDMELITEGEKEEIEITAQRLMHRTLSVDVTVTTPRNENQQKALNKVNKLYDDVLATMSTDPVRTMDTLQQYINACLSDCRGPIHQKFQAAILECTADDQKGMRRRLENLMHRRERS